MIKTQLRTFMAGLVCRIFCNTMAIRFGPRCWKNRFSMRLFDKINVDSILNEGLNESNMFTQFDARFLSPDEEVVVPNSTMFPSAISKNGGQVLNKAIIAGVFIAGIGAGITLDSAINTNPKDLASRDAIDKNAPNPKLCATYGSSAMVLDQRIFITFNPFNVYVTQADTKPGCVMRPANVVSQLQRQRRLLNDEQISACKNGFNTWAFVGDINSNPQLSCVFQSDDAQNEFLSNPKVGLGEDIYDKKIK